MRKENTKLTDKAIEYRYNILKDCVARMDALGLKGKRREEEALSYLCGAITALKGSTWYGLAGNMEVLLTMLFSVRGAYSEAVRMVAEFEEKGN